MSVGSIILQASIFHNFVDTVSIFKLMLYCGFLFPAPIYVIQYLFDEAQIHVDNVFEHDQIRSDISASLVSKSQWDYLYKLGQEVRHTLENVS